MTTKTRLTIVGVTLLIGLLALIGVSLWTIDEIRVNGPLYARIVQGKDLVADILPPPEYALEAHDLGLQIEREPGAGRRAELAERLRKAADDFDERHDFWKKELEQRPVLRDQMETNYRAGHAYLEVLLREVVPARLRGERATDALARAEKLFDAHRAEVLKLVKLSDERSKVDEAAGRDIVRSRVVLVLSMAFIVLAVGIAMGLLTARQVGRGIAALMRESEALSVAVTGGDLGHRASAEAVPAEFAPVARAMNHTMDAFAKPIQMASSNMERISRGDIPEQVQEAYSGDFDQIKQSVNRCITAVAAVVEDSKVLASAAVAGKLSARADPARHQGDFRRIVEGFNGTLDAVLKPIEEAAQVLQGLAQRDLRVRVKGSYQGDHARITEALNITAEALHDALAQVAQAADQVSSASGQIASSSQAVASGASEQASSLEETGASLESMSSTTKNAADNAQQASTLASVANGAATEGAAAMQQMAGAMAKIKASAEGTSQIIKDINEIAFQTNLLALNAAVEAARAGEAGRGFAVVAEEVRSLALRSKEAANKTEELIRQAVREASEGEVTAGHVNEKLTQIVASISKVTGIVAEISAAAREQVTSIDQINHAMSQMNSVTQQNAASSEQSSSAAQELSGRSEDLSAMVRSFTLEVTSRTRPEASHGAARPGPKPAVKNLRARHVAPPVRPEDVIPMQDDASFREF